MIRLASSLLMLLAYGINSAQCPTETSVFFDTQAQLDSFIQEYPDCEEYNGYMRFSWEGAAGGPPISDLTPLSGLTHIGNLHFKNDDQGLLTDFTGMDNLKTLGRLILEDLCCIKDLTGFSSLDTIYGDSFSETRFWNLQSFQSLNGALPLHLENGISAKNNPVLTSLGGATYPARSVYMELIDNPLLTDMGGLSDVTWGKSVVVKGLEDISFLENLELTGGLTIYGNDSVTDLSALKSLQGLNSMRLYNLKNLYNLDAIRNVYNWGFLHIENCPLEDVGPFILRSPPQFQLRCINNPNLKTFSLLQGTKEFRELTISNCPSITDMDDFEDLEIMQYHLHLDTLISLTDLSGLGNLRYIGRDFYFNGNPQIENFSGLDKLEEVGYECHIRDNARLIDFNGLNALRNIGYKSYFELNPQLRSFDGIETLVNADPLVGAPYIYIRDNPELISIESLQNIQSHYTFRVYDNPKLSECAIPPVCFALSQDQHSIIRDNAIGCQDEPPVQAQCAFSHKPVKVFLDENLDGNYLQSEPGVQLGSFAFDTYRIFPDQNGIIDIPVSAGPADLTYLNDARWAVSTGNAVGTYNDMNLDTLFIGIIPIVDIDSFKVKFHYDHIICDTDYTLEVSVKNLGTTVRDVTVDIKGFGEFLETSGIPFTTAGSTYSINLNSVLPGSSRGFFIKYHALDVSEYDLGDPFELSLEAKAMENGGNSVWSDTLVQEEVFLCSYDPNDKITLPSGTGPEGLTDIDQTEFQYLIRFQNEGNWPANTVVLRDTLDEIFDPSTFAFLSASHVVADMRMSGQMLEVVFENINLPGAIINESESQGFFSFLISRTDMAVEGGRKIENTAHIYFDSNPPITTNTTLNTLVKEVPNAVEEVIEKGIQLFPNPANQSITIVISDGSVPEGMLLYDVHGIIVQRITNGKKVIDLQGYPAGIYFLRAGEQVLRVVVKR